MWDVMPCLVIVVGNRRPPNTWYSSRPGRGDPSFKPASMPTARSYLAAASLGPGLAGVFGGVASNILAVNEVYDYSVNVWISRAPMPTARYGAAAAPLGPGLAGVFGGADNSGLVATTHVYNYDSNTWTTRASMPTPRSQIAAASLGPGLGGVFGGYDASPLGLNEVYDYNTNTWMSRAPMPTARSYPAAAPLAPGLAGVFGGIYYTPSPAPLATNEVYNYNTNTWMSRASMPTARGYLSAADLEAGLVGTFGGSSGSSHETANEIYAY